MLSGCAIDIVNAEAQSDPMLGNTAPTKLERKMIAIAASAGNRARPFPGALGAGSSRPGARARMRGAL